MEATLSAEPPKCHWVARLWLPRSVVAQAVTHLVLDALEWLLHKVQGLRLPWDVPRPLQLVRRGLSLFICRSCPVVIGRCSSLFVGESPGLPVKGCFQRSRKKKVGFYQMPC